jgi:hypothetical protein
MSSTTKRSDARHVFDRTLNNGVVMPGPGFGKKGSLISARDMMPGLQAP